MGESELHRLLKKLGVAYLHNQGCQMVAMEVGVVRDRQEIEAKREAPHKLDKHFIIDVVGLGRKYIPYVKRDFNISYDKENYYQQVLRGIEVKVSKSDFRNGFCCTGCNYHYLLTPMKMVNPVDLPKWVGLLEYDEGKPKIRFSQNQGFRLDGLKVVKRPKFREITERQLRKTIVTIGTSLHWTLIGILADELTMEEA